MGEKDRIGVSGVGVQCHVSACAARDKRMREIVRLHYFNTDIKDTDFWRMIAVMREEAYIWLPEPEATKDKLVVVSAQPATKHLNTEMLEMLKAEMVRKGYFGWMTPEGFLILRETRKTHAFDKVCSSLELKLPEILKEKD